MLRTFELAERSGDLSTRIGAVLLDRHFVVAEGWNDIPPGVGQAPQRRETPLKDDFTLHCEVWTLLDAARRGVSTAETTMVCALAACARCAQAIVRAGVSRVVRLPLDFWLPRMPHYTTSVRHGDTILGEAGVEIHELATRYGVSLRIGGDWVEV